MGEPVNKSFRVGAHIRMIAENDERTQWTISAGGHIFPGDTGVIISHTNDETSCWRVRYDDGREADVWIKYMECVDLPAQEPWKTRSKRQLTL
jgi:hypothetical protein